MCLMEGQWIEALDHNSPSAAVIQLSFRTTEDGRTLESLSLQIIFKAYFTEIQNSV